MFNKLGFLFTFVSLLFLTVSANNDKDDKKHRRFDIIVGGDAGLVYTPPVVYPEVGDTLRFWFRAKNHSVTQGSFNKPCTKLKHGFDSGFNPVSPHQKHDFPYFDVKVKNKKPIWVHCEQKGHCPAGMVFAANPDIEGKKTFAKFLAKALALQSISPPAPQPTAGHGYSAKFRRLNSEDEEEAEVEGEAEVI